MLQERVEGTRLGPPPRACGKAPASATVEARPDATTTEALCAVLRIYLFGQIRLEYDGGAWKYAALPKTLPLWAYLLLHGDHPLERARLAFTLWPDDSEPAALANLRRHLYALRRTLPPPGDQPWLLTDAETVRWNPAAAYWLDVAEFERGSAADETLPRGGRALRRRPAGDRVR